LAEGQTYDVDLKEIKVATLTAKLNSKYPFAATEDLVKGIDMHFFEQKEDIRMRKIAKREEIKKRMYAVVYPCNGMPTNVIPQLVEAK
ncbi:MAG: hypothetical protein K0S32_3945, partial [Bacteroidetes bacterium]|jgi:hypothetical protein|nr:hypothetical protein [Bacteroidota bacterium]